MGEQRVREKTDPERLHRFEKFLIEDVQALEMMLSEGMVESNMRRIGAEQELFLIDDALQPAPVATDLLSSLDDPHFTTELARFNLEFNLDPLPLKGKCFSKLEADVNQHIAKARKAAQPLGADVLLTGILPTLRKAHLGLDNMTPLPRYAALNEAVSRMRGIAYELFLKGIDDLYLKHDSVMLEACNTSFQVHMQVDPDAFARMYNFAQAAAAPTLALAANAPFFLGRRLWHETRIGLFQQSVETRQRPSHQRQTIPRVHFGTRWLKDSVLELFHDDIIRHRVLLDAEVSERALETLKKGRIPKLKALQLHNGTIYRWMRPCYGITNGKPHLRIENRLLPAGPTVPDEVANAVFWLGIMHGLASEYDDVTNYLRFDEAKSNFLAAARLGLRAQFAWLDGTVLPAKQLIAEHLLPLAQSGLQSCGVDEKDISRYLGIIEQRISAGQTGAEWQLRSFAEMDVPGRIDQKMTALTAAVRDLQQEGKPVHEWPLASLSARGDWKQHYQRVGQFMSTDLYTVHPEDSIDLVISAMQWRKIRQIPVEDARNRLQGMVTYQSLLKLLQTARDNPESATAPVSEIMQQNFPTVSPEVSSLEAIEKMRRHGASCLPVVNDENRLIGIITEFDFMKITSHFLQEGRSSESTDGDRRSKQNAP